MICFPLNINGNDWRFWLVNAFTEGFTDEYVFSIYTDEYVFSIYTYIYVSILFNTQTTRFLTSHKGPTWAWEARVHSHLYICNNEMYITYV